MGALPPDGALRLSGGWRLARLAGTASALHARPLVTGQGRRIEVLEPTSRAIVLGSTQPASIVDAATAAATATEIARRRSGGGAVLLVPGAVTWVDVTIGRDDELWDDDVAVAFHWLGRAWVTALGRLGVEATVHTGPMVETPWSRRVCFAGLGAGEVLVGGRKAVGISQRRTREGARFQCVALRHWDAGAVLDLLALTEAERAAGRAALAGVASGLSATTDELVAALTASLPA